MNKKRWFELDRERNGPITLWDFSNPWDANDAVLVDETAKKGGWRISDDSVIGGYSRADFQLVQTPQDFQQVLRGEPTFSMQPDTVDSQDTSFSEDESLEPITPFIRWKGNIDTRINKEFNADKHIMRSGFCAIRSPEYPFGGADLGGRYNALEITCRSDGRPYSVNLRCESIIPEDIFQCFISIPPTLEHGKEQETVDGGRFDQVVLLFRHFIVTAGGRMRANQRVLDNSIKIQSIGFTLMDGVDGNFQFDLARVRAVNYDETGVIGEAD
eukprot:Nitzschia sp. Nitz4//scaffold119_size111653//60909//61721//NITZ4_004195-RA/size111653-processed-gene-0.14-mRNA-1//1//CDS//3329533851//6566//frame0